MLNFSKNNLNNAESVLIIGDGDFSFSKSLIKFVNNKLSIISSCYESYDEIVDKYSQVKSNIEFITNNGITIKYSIDATNFQRNDFNEDFDVIIFNFPHRGGKSNIKKNRLLLKDFFKSISSSGILREHGSVFVSLCQGQAGTNIDVNDRDFGNSWQIEDMAAQSNYYLFDVRKFDLTNFGDYIPTGFRSQEKRFRLADARTYVFVKCDNVESCGLYDEVIIDGQVYRGPSWIKELGVETEDVSLNDGVVKYVVECCEDDGSHYIKWCNMFCYDYGICGYGLCTKEGIEDPRYLCSSPWQQILRIISADPHNLDLRGGVFTHGTCFSPSRDNSEGVIRSYIVIIKAEPCADNQSQYQKHPLDQSIKELMLKGDLEILSMESDRMFGIPCSVIRMLRTDQCYNVTLFDTSKYLLERFEINPLDSFVNLTHLKKRWSRTLNVIFPTHFTAPVFHVPSFLNDYSEVIKILSQRKSLDVHLFRDMSFWLPNNNVEVRQLLNEIDEICRCVFRRHIEGKVSLVDDYFDQESGRRSICVRMFMRSGLTAFSRDKVNKLQSAVRRFCQTKFSIILR